MTIAYIAHPIGGDVNANVLDLLRIIRKINLTQPNVIPYCPYLSDVLALRDHIPAERKRGLANGRAMVVKADQLWLTGNRISQGMEGEVAVAAANNIPVINKINQL